MLADEVDKEEEEEADADADAGAGAEAEADAEDEEETGKVADTSSAASRDGLIDKVTDLAMPSKASERPAKEPLPPVPSTRPCVSVAFTKGVTTLSAKMASAMSPRDTARKARRVCMYARDEKLSLLLLSTPSADVLEAEVSDREDDDDDDEESAEAG